MDGLCDMMFFGLSTGLDFHGLCYRCRISIVGQALGGERFLRWSSW
jgi:hypothetical protein